MTDFLSSHHKSLSVLPHRFFLSLPASTVNGYAASKLVSIWQDGKVIASDITVDHPTSSDKYRASSTVEGGLEQDFTSQGLYQNQTPSNVLVKALPEGTDRTSLTLILPPL